MSNLRCLPLWQPWASAIPLGLKSYETRNRITHVRGMIGIYATQRFPPGAQRFATAEVHAGRLPSTLSFGCIVAICDLTDCFPVEQIRDLLSPVELSYGDYSDGRFAWKLENVVRLKEPYQVKGAQGWFNRMVPDDLLTGGSK